MHGAGICAWIWWPWGAGPGDASWAPLATPPPSRASGHSLSEGSGSRALLPSASTCPTSACSGRDVGRGTRDRPSESVLREATSVSRRPCRRPGLRRRPGGRAGRAASRLCGGCASLVRGFGNEVFPGVNAFGSARPRARPRVSEACEDSRLPLPPPLARTAGRPVQPGHFQHQPSLRHPPVPTGLRREDVDLQVDRGGAGTRSAG